MGGGGLFVPDRDSVAPAGSGVAGGCFSGGRPVSGLGLDSGLTGSGGGSALSTVL